MPQPISTDSSSFPEIRKKGCVYVDKTAYFHKLITAADSRFFISHPRRFGKSLMISTLKAIFEGRRELFDGLAIAKTDWQWEKYPVLYFDFSFASAPSFKRFEQNFAPVIHSALTEAGFEYDEKQTPEVNFGKAIDSLAAANSKQGVVILIDEYDDPVAQLLAKEDEAEKVRELLAGFFHQMKDRTEIIRFLMTTGVSKFTKMSVFSALSNLRDISFDTDYATMLGYTEEELDTFFGEHTHAHAERMGLSYDDYRAKLRQWFNGYRFGKSSTQKVYNPVSIGLNLSKLEPYLESCWSSTGKAAMLMNFLKREEVLELDMDNITDVQEIDFDVSNIRALKPIPMLFQTGYLTISDYDPDTQMYSLCVPDFEVRQDLAMLMTTLTVNEDTLWVSNMKGQLFKSNWEEFFEGLKALYASLPYGAKEKKTHEHSYERNLLILLWALGIPSQAEARQSDGQADVVAVHKRGIFIFELKVDESADAALKQVKEKGYDTPYRAMHAPIWHIGLNFDSKTRRLTDAKAERLSATE